MLLILFIFRTSQHKWVGLFIFFTLCFISNRAAHAEAYDQFLYRPINTACPPRELDRLSHVLSRTTSQIVTEYGTSDTPDLEKNLDSAVGHVTQSLPYCGSEAVPSLRQSFSQLIQLDPAISLPSSNSSVRAFYLNNVIEALGQIGPDAVDAVPGLTDALAQEDLQCAAAIALRNIGASLSISHSQLVSYLVTYQDSQSYPEAACRIALAELIGQAGEPEIAIAELLRILSDNEIYIGSRIDAAEAIARLGNSALATTQLLSILENPSTVAAGEQTALVLSRLNIDVSQLKPEVLRILQSGSSTEGQTSAALALSRFDITSDEVIAALTQVIDTEQNSSVIASSALALVLAGADSQTIAAALSDSVQNLANDQTEWGYYDHNALLELQLIILQFLGDDATLLVPPLIEIINTNQDWRVRSSVLKLLGAIGFRAEPAVEELVTVFNNKLHDEAHLEGYESEIILRQIIGTLGLIGTNSDAAVNALIQTLQDKRSEYLVLDAVRALGSLGPHGKKATDELLNLLDDDNLMDEAGELLRSEVVRTLGLMESDSDHVMATLLEILVLSMLELGDHNDSSSFWGAKFLAISTAEALSYLGKTDVAILSLLRLIEDDIDRISALDAFELYYTISSEAWYSIYVGHTIETIGRPAIPPMLMALSDTNVQRQRAAAYGLLRVGPLPDNVLNSLVEVLQDERRDPEVRRFAAYRLNASGKDADWFFQQENLVKPEQAICIEYPDYFEPYVGQCIVLPKNGPGDIFVWLKERVRR